MIKQVSGVSNPHNTVASSGIPLILPSSGTIGNNGALSGITALQQTYTSGYAYFPANAIAAGVAAGMYYVVMSSTTAGTIYNNTYTSGMPTIPAVPTPFVTTGPGLYTQTTAVAIPLCTITIPGGSMGLNGTLRIITMLSNAGSINAKTQVWTFGGVTIQSVAQATAANIATEWNNWIQNCGAQNVQTFSAVGQAGFGVSTAPNVRAAVDTSVNQNLVFTCTLAAAADWNVIDGFHVTAMHF